MTENRLDRGAMLQLIDDCDPDLGEVIRDLHWAAERVGPAVAMRLTGIAGQLLTAAEDLAALRLDVEGNRYPASLADDDQLALPLDRAA